MWFVFGMVCGIVLFFVVALAAGTRIDMPEDYENDEWYD